MNTEMSKNYIKLGKFESASSNFFYPKTFVSPLWSAAWKFKLKKVGVAAVFFINKSGVQIWFRALFGKKKLKGIGIWYQSQNR